MMIHIGYAAACLPLGFVFGWGICLALEWAYVRHCRRAKRSAEVCLECFAAAARDVLADSWYKKVVKAYKAKVEERCKMSEEAILYRRAQPRGSRGQGVREKRGGEMSDTIIIRRNGEKFAVDCATVLEAFNGCLKVKFIYSICPNCGVAETSWIPVRKVGECETSGKYTAQEMREMADKLDGENSEYAICHYDKRDDEWRPLWKNPNSAVLALRQAADAEEDNAKLRETINADSASMAGKDAVIAQLKARLEAVVKECERVRRIGETRIGEKVLTYNPIINAIADSILRAARGEGGAE